MSITPEMMAEDERRWGTRDVITELGYCGNYMCDRKDMTNLDIRFYAYLMRKAHDMLKAQEPRVMTREEASETLMHGDFVIVEDRVLDMIWLGMRGNDNMELASGEYFDFDDLEKQDYRNKYGKSFRFWTSRPSPEQMRDTKWEGDSDAE